MSHRGAEFGQADDIHYEEINVPTLFIAGANDRLRAPHYADRPASRMPNAKVVTLPGSGHCPNIEQAPRVAELLLDFFQQTG